LRIVSVVGTRPQLIKAAALMPALRRHHDEIFVDTGQHYDDALAGSFFAELGLPRPDHSLGIGGGTQAQQTGRMLEAVEAVLLATRPDAALVYGDTNSTLAGALAAAKLGIPVAHVEAGLRSFDRRMPEEINRVVADHLSTWLFVPTSAGVANLAAEGVVDGVFLVGDVMQDLAASMISMIRDPGSIAGLGLSPGSYLFATIHRVENRAPDAITRWVGLLETVARADRPVVLALHPGTRMALEATGVRLPSTLRLIDPQGYRTALALQLHAAAVLTDSGGIQREAGWLGVPCLILRASSEWTEIIDQSGGAIALIGLDPVRAVDFLERFAPADAPDLARRRAIGLNLQPAGAGTAISAALR
jgi:UDP-GlcNAc3NAcA epimerase